METMIPSSSSNDAACFAASSVSLDLTQTSIMENFLHSDLMPESVSIASAGMK